MKLFSTEQIRAWDDFTIRNEPVSSVALMDRAAAAFTAWLTGIFPDTERTFFIWAGTGNNGGDGLAVARLLHRAFYRTMVCVCDLGGRHSPDFEAQVAALPRHEGVELQWLRAGEALPEIPADAVVIDALFGSGLTRPLEGEWVRVIDFLNSLPHEVVAIDLPSGLFADRASSGATVRASRTFSFETPKLAFLFPENADKVGEWDYGSIGLHPEYVRRTETPFHYLTEEDVRSFLLPRHKFSHKGTFGHALLIGGSYGKIGAVSLAARACLRSGAGLVTLRAPRCGYSILQGAAPEAMCSPDPGEEIWTEAPDPAPYEAVGVGPGLGQAPETAAALERLLQLRPARLVLDADALNLLAAHPHWWKILPEGTILTPHPKEFERLFGPCAGDFGRLALQRAKAREHGVVILLKGAHTAVATPDGNCYFNSTGNPGMATGGTGDVLTGLLTGLLAQGYSPVAAACLGVYLHGLAGDLAAAAQSQPGMTAGDVAEWIGLSWNGISQKN